MAPRAYRLGRRAAGVEATRQRIIEATIALHAEQGIVATSHRDVARRADVGVGTVYHHFPTIDDLVVACGGRLFELTRPPTPEVLEGIRSRTARVQRLVAEVFGWYERYPQWRRATCDADKLEVLARSMQRREGVLRDLVAGALGPGADATTVATVRAVVDFEVYTSLVGSGLSSAEAAHTIADVLVTWLRRHERGRRGGTRHAGAP